MKPMLIGSIRGVVYLSLLFIALAGCAPTVQVVTPVPASTPSDDQVNAIARELYCPVCENVPLDVCPTEACARWRGVIRDKLAQGWSEAQIKDYFVAQYGDRVLAEPPPQGLNWLVYILPPLFFVLGGAILWRVLRAMRRQPMQEEIASPPPSSVDSYLARLEEELRQRDRQP